MSQGFNYSRFDEARFDVIEYLVGASDVLSLADHLRRAARVANTDLLALTDSIARTAKALAADTISVSDEMRKYLRAVTEDALRLCSENIFVPAKVFSEAEGLQGWNSQQGAQVTRSGDVALVGTHSMKVIAPENDLNFVGAVSGLSTLLVPGRKYRASCSAYIPEGMTLGGTWQPMHIHCFGDGMPVHSYTTHAQARDINDSTPRGQWIERWIEFTPHQGENVRFRAFVITTQVQARGTVYADDFRVVDLQAETLAARVGKDVSDALALTDSIYRGTARHLADALSILDLVAILASLPRSNRLRFQTCLGASLCRLYLRHSLWLTPL